MSIVSFVSELVTLSHNPPKSLQAFWWALKKKLFSVKDLDFLLRQKKKDMKSNSYSFTNIRRVSTGFIVIIKDRFAPCKLKNIELTI